MGSGERSPSRWPPRLIRRLRERRCRAWSGPQGRVDRQWNLGPQHEPTLLAGRAEAGFDPGQPCSLFEAPRVGGLLGSLDPRPTTFASSFAAPIAPSSRNYSPRSILGLSCLILRVLSPKLTSKYRRKKGCKQSPILGIFWARSDASIEPQIDPVYTF